MKFVDGKLARVVGATAIDVMLERRPLPCAIIKKGFAADRAAKTLR
jgi:hypothetical protein